MKKISKWLFLAAGLGLLTAISVSAETEKFTTGDGVLTLELPDETWQQVQDSQTWVTLSNGSGVITLYHLSNGEKLPDPVTAGGAYSDVCQSYLSSKNEVFVITGSVKDSDDFGEVREAVQSVVINQKDTKKAVVPNSWQEISVSAEEQVDFIRYVTAGSLNVRAGSSSSDYVIGTLSYGDSVEVTADKGNGWYEIAYQGMKGYVAAQYLSEEKPVYQQETAFGVGSTKELYYANGNTVVITKYSDGNWRDEGGIVYITSGEDGSVWSNSAGSRLTTYDPWEAGELPEADDGVRYLRNMATGEEATIYETIDGGWIDKAETSYSRNEYQLWIASDGSEWIEE